MEISTETLPDKPNTSQRVRFSLPRFRTILFWTHLTIGLAAALPVFVMCVTGVLLAYEIQIEAYIDHLGIESSPSPPGTQALSVEKLIEITHGNSGVDPESITIFRDPARPVEIEVKGIAGAVYLDTYSGSVIGGPSRKTRQFFQKVLAWHLFLGASGPHRLRFRVLQRGVNALALLSLIIGVYIWVPRRWSWAHLRAVALPRWGAPGRARDFNWHNAIGIWSAVPLLIILWTGMAMSYKWASRLTNWDTGSPAGKTASPKNVAQNVSPPNAQFLNLDVLLSHAKQQDTRWKAITVFVPRQDSDQVHFAIQMKDYTGIGTVAGLMLDRTGKVLYFTPAGAAGISPPTFIRFGHTGEAWGVAGQTIAAFASLGGAILVWTGVTLSLRRWRASQARRTKAAR